MNTITDSYHYDKLEDEGLLQVKRRDTIYRMGTQLAKQITSGCSPVLVNFIETKTVVSLDRVKTKLSFEVEKVNLTYNATSLRQQQTIRKLFEALKERLKDDAISVKTLETIQEELEK